MERCQHVGQLEPDGLMLGDRLAEGDALARVADGRPVGRAGEPHRDRRRHHADLREDPPDLLDAAALAAQEMLDGHLDVLEEDLAGDRGTHRHLVDRLAERDAAHRAPVQQEERDVLHTPLVRRLRGHGQEITHVFVPRST